MSNSEITSEGILKAVEVGAQLQHKFMSCRLLNFSYGSTEFNEVVSRDCNKFIGADKCPC